MLLKSKLNKILISREIILSYVNYLGNLLFPFLKKISVNYYKNNINLYLRDSNDILKILSFFKKHSNTQYYVLSDLFGVDCMGLRDIGRFQVIYTLLSVRFNSRINIIITVNDVTTIPSVSNLFKSAGWLERETWDMFGLYFKNNNDLRRILTDYGFDGFPLRKDFPLSGYVELRYDDSLKRVIYEPLEISQEFRFFDFRSPWEQIKNIY